jgi:hypothetical protein
MEKLIQNMDRPEVTQQGCFLADEPAFVPGLLALDDWLLAPSLAGRCSTLSSRCVCLRMEYAPCLGGQGICAEFSGGI